MLHEYANFNEKCLHNRRPAKTLIEVMKKLIEVSETDKKESFNKNNFSQKQVFTKNKFSQKQVLTKTFTY